MPPARRDIRSAVDDGLMTLPLAGQPPGGWRPPRRALRWKAVSERPTVPLEVKLDGRKVASETVCMWAGPYVLVVATTLPEKELAIELHSAFVGHKGVPTLATHLNLGPVGHAAFAVTGQHEHANLDPQLRARECVYEHAGVLLETLKGLGYDAGIDLADDAFGELERVEG
jgi:hypothetical protein